jgi:hypothetical protein
MTKHPESAIQTETGRRSEPIEITPEMIGAGVSILAGFNRDNETLEEGVCAVLEAALAATRT